MSAKHFTQYKAVKPTEYSLSNIESLLNKKKMPIPETGLTAIVPSPSTKDNLQVQDEAPFKESRQSTYTSTDPNFTFSTELANDALELSPDNEFIDSSGVIQRALKRAKLPTFKYKDGELNRGCKSTGNCGWGVADIFEELGLNGYIWDTNNPATATDTNITKKGFYKVGAWSTQAEVLENLYRVLEPGDIVIQYGVRPDNTPSAHIHMYDGEGNFISDFTTRHPIVYDQLRPNKNNVSVEVYRYKPKNVDKGEKGMKTKVLDQKDKTEDQKKFEEFLVTTPPNIKNTDPAEYRMYRYWELNGKPETFWEGVSKDMFIWNDRDKSFHGNSVAQNEKGEYEFMKLPNHPTTHMELDWFNEGKKYTDDGNFYLLTPEHGEEYDRWLKFKTYYDLDDSGEYFKYVPKEIPKDEQGAKIIVIEKETTPIVEVEEDPLKCLLCQIMNAMGHRHHAFKELRPDKLTDIFGGNAEIVIELGGPEKAYDEDSFVEMIKDILPLVSTSKKYKKEDIEKIRSEKASHGTSMKRLLALMDDDKILKAFNGMQFYKAGGEIRFEAEGGQIEELSTITVEIEDIKYTLYEAKTDEQKKRGLNDVSDLKENEGMIFYWDEIQDEVTMTMKDCKIPLKMCFFDDDEECVHVEDCDPLSDEPIIVKGKIKYVVELHPSASVKVGDEIDFEDDDEYVMQVLGSDGSIQMQLKGGERIFSRPNTKMLLKHAKKSYLSKDIKDYRKLGKLLFKYLDQQDNREPEYVQLDSKNN